MGAWVTRAPRTCLAVFALLLLAASVCASRIPYDISFRPLYLNDEVLLDDTETFIEQFDNVNNMILTVFEGGDLFARESVVAFTRMTDRLESIEHVDSVYSYTNVPIIRRTEEGFSANGLFDGEESSSLDALRAEALEYPLYANRMLSADGSKAGLVVQLDDRFVQETTEQQRRPVLGEIEAVLDAEMPSGFRRETLGTRTLERDYSLMLDRDQQVFFGLGYAINLVLLFWALRSVAMVLAAMGTTVVALVLSLGAVERLGLSLDILTTQMIPMVQVVATAQIVHLAYAYYTELRAGTEKVDAVRRAVREVSAANLGASATTAIGFLSLLAASVTSVREFGIKMATAVTIIYFVVMAMLPALLVVMRPPSQRALERTSDLGMTNRLLAAFFRMRKRPALSIGLLLLLAIPSIYGISQIEIENYAMGEVSREHPLAVAMRATDEVSGFTGFEVSVRSEDGLTLMEPERLRAMDALTQFMKDEAGVITAWSVSDYLKEMNRAVSDEGGGQREIPASAPLVSQLLLTYSLSNEGARQIEGLVSADRLHARIVGRVRDIGAVKYLALRERVEQKARELFGGGVRVEVLCEPLLVFRGLDRIVRDLVSSFSVAFLFVFAVVFVASRSLRLGFGSILPNILPVLLAGAIMGLFSIPLRVGTTIFFSMALAIAVDNTVHYLIRYRRGVSEGRPSEEVLKRTHFEVGRAALASSSVMAFGFLATLPSDFLTLRDMAILNSSTLAIAFITDMWLLPLVLTRFPLRTPDVLSGGLGRTVTPVESA